MPRARTETMRFATSKGVCAPIYLALAFLIGFMAFKTIKPYSSIPGHNRLTGFVLKFLQKKPPPSLSKNFCIKLTVSKSCSEGERFYFFAVGGGGPIGLLKCLPAKSGSCAGLAIGRKVRPSLDLPCAAPNQVDAESALVALVQD